MHEKFQNCRPTHHNNYSPMIKERMRFSDHVAGTEERLVNTSFCSENL